MVLEIPTMPSLFPNSQAQGEGFDASNQQEIINSVGSGAFIPVGGIIAWDKPEDFIAGAPTLPDGFVECNGQVLADPESIYNGLTIQDLNGVGGAENNKFLRGNSVSGTTGGTTQHQHTLTAKALQGGGDTGTNPSSKTGNTSTLPVYYTVVWIIRIK